LKRCMDKEVQLLDYLIQSNRKGQDAFAQVYVRVMIEGKESGGRGVAQDVLEASAKAYLNAVNVYLVLKTYK
uniref:alpha-isopropylmalate synthase regulatory domain-containing protein n=1 Tax=Bacillus licheniformis TaxID=1402 RepID=UPI0034A04BF6